MKTLHITVEEYLDGKGELHKINSLYNRTGHDGGVYNYIGNFGGYDEDNFDYILYINKDRVEKIHRSSVYVEIEVKPIYIAI